jgi:TolB-like protein/Tfp pilus assembly protein PilF
MDMGPGEREHRSVWERLRHRKVAEWSVAYVAGAWGLLQGVAFMRDTFGWPRQLQQAATILLLAGLPIAITLAWFHGDRGEQRVRLAEFAIITVLFLAGGALFWRYGHLAGPDSAPAAAEVGSTPTTSHATAISHPTIAVLPFTNLSGDPGQEFFSDGMTEEINAALAGIRELKVVARTSAFQFKGQNRNIRAVGKDLGATHVIEGSVRRAGDRLRITARLVQSESGLELWSESYDRRLTDIFEIQEEIARAIATAMQAPLGLRRGENLVPRRDVDVATYQDYLRAKALVRDRQASKVQAAIAMLEQMVATKPDYAQAWALLALAHAVEPQVPAWFSGVLDEAQPIAEDALPKAEAAARRAIELDDILADGHLALARVYTLQGDLLRGEAALVKALALDPTRPDALHLYANLLAAVGRLEESLVMARQLLDQEPYVPIYSANAATILWLNGQDDAAIAVLEASPPGPSVGIALSWIHAAAGRYDDAADALSKSPQGTFLPGTVEAAVRLLRAGPVSADSHRSLPNLGVLDRYYLHLGAVEQAFDFYEFMVDVNYVPVINLALLWHPSSAPLRKAARFKSFARNAGLVEYWRAKGWPTFCRPVGAADFACD